MGQVVFPLTGAGDANAAAWTDLVGGAHYQVIKIASGEVGSTVPMVVRETTPGSTDPGVVTRPIGSTAFNQAVVGTVTADLSSAGSTKLVGQVTINNPTTAVNVANPTTAVTISNATTATDASLTSIGSTRLVGQVTINNPTTAVEANLSSVGSTRLVGQVTINNPTTAVEANLSSVGSTKLVGQFTVANPTTSVTVTSGVILGAGSSANMLGQVQATGTTTVNVSSGVILGPGSTANALGSVALLAGSSANMLGTVVISSGTTAITLGSVALLAGSSANMLGTVVISSGSTAITLGSAALLAGSSANILGQVVQGPGSSANFWYQQSIPFSSGNMARTTVNTTIDISIVAANAARKALVIANLSTAQIVAIGMSTGVVTTGLANANLFLQPNSQLSFGLGGGLPLFLGPFRGINISSTALAGGVAVMEFT